MLLRFSLNTRSLKQEQTVKVYNMYVYCISRRLDIGKMNFDLLVGFIAILAELRLITSTFKLSRDVSI